MKALKLNGAPLVLNQPYKIVSRALEFLRHLPTDELLSTVELARQLGYRAHSGQELRSDPLLNSHRHRFKNKIYFGSEAAIQELKRRINETG